MRELNHSNGVLKLNNFKNYHLTYDWPNFYIQANTSGVVLQENPYTTAFFEIFPDHTFIRGEGKTVKEAEHQAWTRYQQFLNCPQHEYKQINDSDRGECTHCGIIYSNVFKAKTLCKQCNQEDAIFQFYDCLLDQDIDYIIKDHLDNINKMVPTAEKEPQYCFKHYSEKLNQLDEDKYQEFINYIENKADENAGNSIFFFIMNSKIENELYLKYYHNEIDNFKNASELKKNMDEIFYGYSIFIRNNIAILSKNMNIQLRIFDAIEIKSQLSNYAANYNLMEHYIKNRKDILNNKNCYLDSDYLKTAILSVINNK